MPTVGRSVLTVAFVDTKTISDRPRFGFPGLCRGRFSTGAAVGLGGTAVEKVRGGNEKSEKQRCASSRFWVLVCNIWEGRIQYTTHCRASEV